MAAENSVFDWFKEHFEPKQEISEIHKAIIEDAIKNPERVITLGRDAWKSMRFIIIEVKYKHSAADVAINPLLAPVSYMIDRVKPDGKIICRFTGGGEPGLVEFDKADFDKLEITTAINF